MNKLILILFFLVSMGPSITYSQNNLSEQLSQISEKEKQIEKIDSTLKKLQNEYQQLAVNPKEGNKEHENTQKELVSEIGKLKSQKRDIEIQILGIEADIYDHEASSPLWTEGYGEAILEEGKKIEECKRLALMYARRDAMEKGGKMIVESLTNWERVEKISEDETATHDEYTERFQQIIRSKAKVEVIDQDLSKSYGKVTKVNEDGLIKFTAKVRLQVKSIGDYNPHRLKINDIKDRRIY